MGTTNRISITWMKLAAFGNLLTKKGETCKGGKLRVTVTFIVSAAGNKEDPVVIWTFEVEFNSLPVKYFDQKKIG